MLTTLAVANYRSINQLAVPLARLNLITGPNGSGKSNLYRALRLLAETAQGGVVNALAREGGLSSTFWAGPEVISRRMKLGEVDVHASVRQETKRLRLGFAGEDFSYAIALGLPIPGRTQFNLDPQIKHESIWAGPFYRPAAASGSTSPKPTAMPTATTPSSMAWNCLTRRSSTGCRHPGTV